ncbi:endonuclease [Carbonactinospora thermoautotrophica]|nr:DEDD exonuclease domain-containing protein [Carbonactinospora thermoautotrophica]MCX9190838.1 endonuclease [Carbonactinospora thermoautotrophica]
MTTAHHRVPRAVQGTFDELGPPLHEVTFVVVDLETTGNSPPGAGITEIGAVKVRGGQVLGEFHTLVDPGTPIPPFITVLTGITDQMVAGAPGIADVLPRFLEFAGGSVLVAHNAPFDVGFLKHACAQHGYAWPGSPVLDTVQLARKLLTRDEVPNYKLATLARYFRSASVPAHRALADARATVDVLHGLFERVAGFGVQTLDELIEFSAAVSSEQRRKRYLADGLPQAPGVYLFTDERGEVLYVGKSSNLRNRVRQYFTGSENRPRIREMIALAERVVPIVCATPLEAEVRELRLIAEHKPRYNRRSRFPERALWVKLTVEPFPRLSIVRRVATDGATYLGPFPGRRLAEQAIHAVHEAFPLRQCTLRLRPGRPVSPCALAGMGRCNAPCAGQESPQEYARHVAAVREAMTGDIRPLVERLLGRIERLSAAQRYEEAATHRDRLAVFVRAAARMQRVAALSGCRQLVAAAPAFDGGWEIAVVRYGRLAGATRVPPGAAPGPYLDAVLATAETVLPGPGPTPAASVEETECVLRWLEQPGVRLIEVDGTWCSPVHGAGSRWEWLRNAYATPFQPSRD